MPKGALQVTATARMWSWSFTYANGKTSPKLYVPVGKPVKVDLVSTDVIHGFFLPAFRVKRDVVPGMKNHAWFVADEARLLRPVLLPVLRHRPLGHDHHRGGAARGGVRGLAAAGD